MSNHDPISDMLTRIRNASQKKHTTTTIPGSKMSLSIAKVLQKEGFISDINEEGEGYKSQIILGLKYSCLLYTSPSPRDVEESRMPSSA